MIRHEWRLGKEDIADFSLHSNKIKCSPEEEILSPLSEKILSAFSGGTLFPQPPKKPGTIPGSNFGFQPGFLNGNRQTAAKTLTGPKPGFFDAEKGKVDSRPSAKPAKQSEDKAGYCGFRAGFLG